VNEPHLIVLFGATGDLARRKLLPGILHLLESDLVPESRIIGVSLDDFDDEQFREFAEQAYREFSTREVDEEKWREFAPKLSYVNVKAGPEALAKAASALEDELGGETRRLHYLSVPPKAALDVVHTLDAAGLVDRARIIMEKPFGTDLASARALNAELHEVFAEDQIFRIDHFLGKEAALNILAFRFANGLFEPIWNRNFIDHVQIDVPETLSVEGRSAFYEGTGAFKDMAVTHLFQVLAFMAMEPPTSLDSDSISEEKNKVFRSMLPLDPHNVVRGQYQGYRDEKGGRAGLRDRHLRGPQGRDRQLALGRRAVLPQDRQEARRGGADHLDRVPRAAQEHVPDRLGRRAGRS
jgi:glucose-6-phosphate 1-dehydrogenase